MYQIGPESGMQSLFNSRAMSDLSLALFDSDGATQLGPIANAVGVGQLETISRQLDPGTYYVRVTGAQDDIQLYQLLVDGSSVDPEALLWTGDFGSAWDLESANFSDGTGATVFRNGDSITFNDAAATTAVALSGAIAPGAIMVNADTSYMFTGAASIGAGGLQKTGIGTAEFTGAFTTAGATQVIGGVLRLSGSGTLTTELHVASGAAIEFAGQHVLSATARLTGDGELRGDVAMPGTIAPGDAIGSILFTDDLALTSTSVLEIELGGTSAGMDFDRLDVGGALTLNGFLEVSLVAGFAPSLGNTFTIVAAGRLIGSFDYFELPQLGPGLYWEMSGDSNHFTLAVIHQPADFNEDGQVDSADLVLWTAGFGNTGAAMHGDGDADGDHAVAGNDFLAWQRQANFTAPSQLATHSVPEPRSIAPTIAALLGAASFARRSEANY
jgi:autotransporter-associated beta strand protein